MEKFTKKVLFPVEELVFAYIFPYFRAWETSQVKSTRLRRKIKQLFCQFSDSFVTRKTLLKTQVFEKQTKMQWNKIYRLQFLVPSSLATSGNKFGLQFSFTQKLCSVWVTFCNTYDFLGITSFTKKAKVQWKRHLAYFVSYHRVWQTSRNICLSATGYWGVECASFNIISVAPN